MVEVGFEAGKLANRSEHGHDLPRGADWSHAHFESILRSVERARDKALCLG